MNYLDRNEFNYAPSQEVVEALKTVSYTHLDVYKRQVIGPAPLTPFTRFSQNSGTLLPMGVMAPRPVTTTLFNSML